MRDDKVIPYAFEGLVYSFEPRDRPSVIFSILEMIQDRNIDQKLQNEFRTYFMSDSSVQFFKSLPGQEPFNTPSEQEPFITPPLGGLTLREFQELNAMVRFNELKKMEEAEFKRNVERMIEQHMIPPAFEQLSLALQNDKHEVLVYIHNIILEKNIGIEFKRIFFQYYISPRAQEPFNTPSEFPASESKPKDPKGRKGGKR
jgi:hypothetical protein